MAKKKEEPYLLNDEEHLSEVDTQITKTYNDKDQESNPDEVSKAIKKANPEDVSYNEDGSISVKEGDVNEVEKTQVMKFDIKSSSDVKALQQMLDKGVDSKKMGVGTDGTISVSENKINLTKKEIMGIIKENKNFVSTKSDLLKTIKNRIISESRMNDNVRRKFEGGDNDYNDILGQDLTNQLAQESFREIADNIRQKTGKENPSFMEIQQFLSNSLLEAAKEEYRLGTENLERKAVAMIRRQFNIPEDAVEFDAKIMGIPPAMLGLPSSTPQTRLDQIARQQGFKIGDIKREGLKFDKGNKPHVMVTYSPNQKRISGDEGAGSSAVKDKYSDYVLDLADFLNVELKSRTQISKSKLLSLKYYFKDRLKEIERLYTDPPYSEYFLIVLNNGKEYYSDGHSVVEKDSIDNLIKNKEAIKGYGISKENEILKSYKDAFNMYKQKAISEKGIKYEYVR